MNRDKPAGKDKKTEVAQLTMWQKTMQSEGGWDFGTVRGEASPSSAVGEEYEEDDLEAERRRLDGVQIGDGSYGTIHKVGSTRRLGYGLCTDISDFSPDPVRAPGARATPAGRFDGSPTRDQDSPHAIDAVQPRQPRRSAVV